MELLTKREKECLDFIKGFIERKGYSPTLREIAKGMRLKSSNSSYIYVYRLKEKERLELGGKKQKNLIVGVAE